MKPHFYLDQSICLFLGGPIDWSNFYLAVMWCSVSAACESYHIFFDALNVPFWRCKLIILYMRSAEGFYFHFPRFWPSDTEQSVNLEWRIQRLSKNEDTKETLAPTPYLQTRQFKKSKKPIVSYSPLLYVIWKVGGYTTTVSKWFQRFLEPQQAYNTPPKTFESVASLVMATKTYVIIPLDKGENIRSKFE